MGPQIISLDSLCRGSGRKARNTNVRVKNLTIIISTKFTKERKKKTINVESENDQTLKISL